MLFHLSKNPEGNNWAETERRRKTSIQKWHFQREEIEKKKPLTHKEAKVDIAKIITGIARDESRDMPTPLF